MNTTKIKNPMVIQLSSCEKILDVEKFIESHKLFIEANKNKPSLIMPFINRLKRLKEHLDSNNIKLNLNISINI